MRLTHMMWYGHLRRSTWFLMINQRVDHDWAKFLGSINPIGRTGKTIRSWNRLFVTQYLSHLPEQIHLVKPQELYSITPNRSANTLRYGIHSIHLLLVKGGLLRIGAHFSVLDAMLKVGASDTTFFLFFFLINMHSFADLHEENNEAPLL